MSDSLPDSSEPPHPDSILRLASAVHRFRIPLISPEDHLSFEESFKSCSEGHKGTKSVMIQVSLYYSYAFHEKITVNQNKIPKTTISIRHVQADLRRDEVKQAMAAGKLPHATLSQALKEYIPLLNQILISCKVQPESARLDSESEIISFSFKSSRNDCSVFLGSHFSFENAIKIRIPYLIQTPQTEKCNTIDLDRETSFLMVLGDRIQQNQKTILLQIRSTHVRASTIHLHIRSFRSQPRMRRLYGWRFSRSGSELCQNGGGIQILGRGSLAQLDGKESATCKNGERGFGGN